MYNALLVNAGACQDLCSATPGCDYFSYEWEETAGARHHECYLKQGFSYNECPHPVMEQYVPWSNANDPAWHGVSGPAVCTPPPPPAPPCIHASMDYGRSSSPCGVELGGEYADTVALFYDHELYDAPGWLSADKVTKNPLLSSEEQCQQLCAAHPNCDFFSYEYELIDDTDGTYAHECFLKAAYVGCTDDDPMAGYGVWTSDDPGSVSYTHLTLPTTPYV